MKLQTVQWGWLALQLKADIIDSSKNLYSKVIYCNKLT